MTTSKEAELKQRYNADCGNKTNIVDVTGYDCKNKYGNPVNLDYYKVITLDFYLWLLDQIP